MFYKMKTILLLTILIFVLLLSETFKIISPKSKDKSGNLAQVFADDKQFFFHQSHLSLR